MPRGAVKRISTPTRKDARWEARLSGRDRDGQRRQFRRRFPTRKAAEAWLSETEHQIHADGIGITPEITLAAYAAIWHARMERSWAPSTTRLRLSTWRRWLK